MPVSEPDEVERLLVDIHKIINENQQFLKKLLDDDVDEEVEPDIVAIEKPEGDDEDFEEL